MFSVASAAMFLLSLKWLLGMMLDSVEDETESLLLDCYVMG